MFFFISHSSLFLIPGVARHSYWHTGRCSEEHRPRVFALQTCGNFCFKQNFEPTSKTMHGWSNLISPVPECSIMVRPICGLPFWFSSSVTQLQTDFWGAGPRGNARTTSYHHWQLTSTHNAQTKKPKWHFWVANFVRSLFIGRSAAQHLGGRLSHLPSAAPVSDTSV